MMPDTTNMTKHRFLSLRRLWIVVILLCGIFAAGPQKAEAASKFALDSIAAWGKFPRFCINTYRWGDRFFNGYDTTYVEGSGYRFNVKVKADSYIDSYDFKFVDDYMMHFHSRPATSMGLWLTYMAVSVGYDINFSKIFKSDIGARKRFNFQFNCALFGAEVFTIINDSYMTINKLGYPGETRKVDISFKGFHSETLGLNLYYFFNHKHYSQGAAFSYSKIQAKSAGSLYAGFAYWREKYDMNFTDVFNDQPEGSQLPLDWENHYRVENTNYALKIGYAYNWVFRPGWLLGVSEAPLIGVRTGYIAVPDKKRTSFALSNRAMLSIVYNHDKRWFFGVVGLMDSGLVYDKEHTMLANNFSIEATAGFRFNLW